MGAWGVKGWIKVQPFSLDPQALFATKRWFLLPPEDASAGLRTTLSVRPLLKVTQAKDHGDMVVACAQDLEGRDAAEALRGARVFVSRNSFPTVNDGEYYWVDLIGMSVFNRDGVELGEVVGLLETGAHDVLRVRPPAPLQEAAPSGRNGPAQPAECLIPFVAAYVDGVDMAVRRITVDWGLDY